MASSSGIKRGLAVSAVSALAITGAPFFAASAHAESLTTSAGGANNVVLASFEDTTTVATANDGTDSTFRLEALGGTNVTSVRFEYSIGASTTRTVIDTVSTRNDNGAFATDWNPTGLNGADLTIYAVGLSSAGTAITGGADSQAGVSVSNSAASVNVADGANIGVFQQPYGGANDDQNVIVSGTASAADGVELSFYDREIPGAQPTDPTTSGFVAGGTANATLPNNPPANATATFSGVLDITGYTYGAGDQLLVSVDNGTSDDTEAYDLYQQTITTVSATAARTTAPAGQATDVVVQVNDQNGKPVAGAQVASSNGGPVQYTNGKGQATFSQQPGTAANAYYYANATASPGYEPELGDKKSDTVAITQYAPAPNALNAHSDNGAQFDRDEYDADDITVQVRDQQGGDLDTTGQTLQYYWVVTPFDGGQTQRFPAETATPNTSAQAVETNGEFIVPLPAAYTTTSGTYELFAGLGANALGNGAVASSKVLTVKVGEAAIKFDQSTPQQAVIGSSATVSGKLVLEDGTGLPNRPIRLTAAGDNAAFDQPTGADAATLDTATGANGGFTGTLDDPNTDTTAETSTVTATTQDFNDDGGDADNANATAAQSVQFVASVTPAQLTATNTGVGSAANNPSVAGSLKTVTFKVQAADTDPNTAGNQGPTLSNQEVKLTTDHGYFTDGVPQGNVGDDAGVYDDDGKSKTYTTDAQGNVTVTLSIGRDEGFDDDGDVTAHVTAAAGTANGSTDVFFTSENPLNGAVSVEFAPEGAQESSVLPKARVGQDVALIVRALDQFGNRVGGVTVNLTDNTNNAAVTDVSGDNSPATVTTDYNNEADAAATATDDVDQTITATWTTAGNQDLVADGNDAGTAPDLGNATQANTVSDSVTINWYAVDAANSTFTLSNNTGGKADVGEAVTETVTAVDQNGQPVEGLTVEFVRSGPGNTSGDVNYVTTTDANGKATYNFTGSDKGTANITAVVRDGNSQVSTLRDSVAFGKAGPGPKEDISDDTVIKGGGRGKKSDKIVVNAPKSAAGASMKLFRIKKNGDRFLVRRDDANKNGNNTFIVPDKNGKKVTKYVVVVKATKSSEKYTSPVIKRK